MTTTPQSSPAHREPTGVGAAEATLVREYTSLVRLAYLALPPELGRHRRVLAAHSVVQRALPGAPASAKNTLLPGQRRATTPDADWARKHVLRAALTYEHRPSGWPRRLPPPRALRPTLPVVWGLRLFPRAGDAADTALAEALSRLPAASRAAFVLRTVDGLTDDTVRDVLDAAGVPEPGRHLKEARALDARVEGAAQTLLTSREFDACSVQAGPTDLIRRRRRRRLAGLAAALAVAGAVLLTQTRPAPTPDAPANRTVSAVLDSGVLTRVPADAWADTGRVDFTAWPARGARTQDKALLTRALHTWADPAGTTVGQAPHTSTEPPHADTQLLYADDVDGWTVVLFHDTDRVVRYAEPASAPGRTALDFARADDSDVTTAAAVTVTRSRDSVRYLTAPWISEVQRRDLLRPDAPGQPVDVSRDGLTPLVPAPAASGGCDAWPVLQLRSSSRIVEKHAFLTTDLGGLTPTHLTYTPLPNSRIPSRQPREATSSAALVSWSRAACELPALRGGAVRSVNHWDFAEQQLPDHGGRTVWSCTRATTWRGPGDVTIQLTGPSGTGESPAVARLRNTAACGRFGQHVLATTPWTSPSGKRYLLAAASRAVTRITVTGDVRATARGRTLDVRLPKKDATTKAEARTADGNTVSDLSTGKPE